MDKDTIRELNDKLQTALLKSKTGAAQDVGIASARVSMLAEIAAQLAEANEYLKCIAHPLIEVVKEKSKPEIVDFSYQGKIQVMEPYATFRDQLAMAALTGLLADPTSAGPEGCAAAAYKYADAMMEARKK